ncbi:hypothetical protein HDU98_006330, partial [Podochytrium sp. JEL0797]
IHCHAGVSRSSTIVLAYLMRFQHLTLYEAWLLTYKARPIIRPNEGFARALQDLEREIHPHLTEPTLPIFWMCDSYANFMEVLELRERANRAGLLGKPSLAVSVVVERPVEAAVVVVSPVEFGGSSSGEEEIAAVGEGLVSVRKGRGRGLSFGGRSG